MARNCFKLDLAVWCCAILKKYRLLQNTFNLLKKLLQSRGIIRFAQLYLKRCHVIISRLLQSFDKEELLKCISELVRVDQEWVPFSNKASLYIRPTMIGTEVRRC